MKKKNNNQQHNFLTSFVDVITNPIIFLPDLVSLIYVIVGTYILVIATGLVDHYSSIILMSQNLATDQLATNFNTFIENNFIKIGLSFGLFFISAFIIGTGTTASKYELITDLIKNKKLTLKEAFTYSHQNFKKVLITKVLIFLLTALLIIGLFILAGVGYTIYQPLGYIITLLLLFVFHLAIYFRYPYLFLKNKKPLTSIKDSIKYFKNNPKHVFLIWLVTILTLLFTQILTSFFNTVIPYLFILIGLYINLSLTVFRFRSL